MSIFKACDKAFQISNALNVTENYLIKRIPSSVIVISAVKWCEPYFNL